jgi:hypothetical protein
MNKTTNYDHIVYIREKDGCHHLCIDRLLENGRREFFTRTPIVRVASEEEGFEHLDKAAEWLGHSICLDSPSFRSTVFGRDSEHDVG